MIDFKELARLILQGWCDRNNTAEDERQPLEHYYEQLTPVKEDADKQDMVWRRGEWRLCLEAQDRLEESAA